MKKISTVTTKKVEKNASQKLTSRYDPPRIELHLTPSFFTTLIWPCALA